MWYVCAPCRHGGAAVFLVKMLLVKVRIYSQKQAAFVGRKLTLQKRKHDSDVPAFR